MQTERNKKICKSQGTSPGSHKWLIKWKTALPHPFYDSFSSEEPRQGLTQLGTAERISKVGTQAGPPGTGVLAEGSSEQENRRCRKPDPRCMSGVTSEEHPSAFSLLLARLLTSCSQKTHYKAFKNSPESA